MEKFHILFTTFTGTISLIMALVLMVSVFTRKNKVQVRSTLVMGGLFSATLVLSMSNPIDLGAGGIHDLRSLLIGTGAALLGPIVGVMTMVTGLAMRWQIGGPGMVAGMVAMVGAFAGGMIWRYTFKDRSFAQWKKSILLGCLVSLHLIGMFLLPLDMWSYLFSTMVPFYILANIVGALLISYLLGGELSFLSEAESSKLHANTDHLTGLLNRRGLELLYPAISLATGHDRGRALLYFDIDNFKIFNDTYGHKTGDDVLRFVTDRIASNLRPNDIFARLGGDEFAVILNQIDANEARHIAERCRKIIGNSGFSHKGADLKVSISVGAIWMLGNTEIDAILDQADKALYVAKAEGRNRVVFEHADNDLEFGDALPA